MEVLCDFKQRIYGIAIDAKDNIFVTNYYNNSIDKVSLNNGKVSITQSTRISSSSPLGLAINSKNDVYIGTNKGEIKKMTKGIFSNIAGNGTIGFADGIGVDSRTGLVFGLCFDENDIAYFCDYDSHSIRKLTPEGKVTTICGGTRGSSDGIGKQARINYPYGIAFNYSTKLFYITDCFNKSIRTMTADGNVNTLCKYSDYLKAIAIDGEGKLYVSTEKDYGEGELITVNTKGEIKQMNIKVTSCYGMAFNSKGDLFFISDNKLFVIRNCTKYPPPPILALPTTINLKGKIQNTYLTIKDLEIQELRKQLITTQAQLLASKTEIQELKKQFATCQEKLSNDLKELKTQNNSLVRETKEQNKNEVFEWLSSIQLENLYTTLQNIGAKNLEFVKLIDENDIEGLNIKPLEKKMLIQSIKKLKEVSTIKVFQNNVNL